MPIKHSPYITWAKQKHGVRFNLARSGVPGPGLRALVDDPAEVLESGSHEDGWLPLMERLAERYGMQPQQVVPVHGCSMANHLAIAALVEADDRVLVEDPCYEPLKLLPEYFHARTKAFRRGASAGWQPDPEELSQLMERQTRMVILSDLHNPTGARLDPGLLQEIATLCAERETWLLVDEVYLEFLYPKGARTAAGLNDWVVTTRSLTKAYGLDDVRLGWIIASPKAAERMRRLRDLYSITTAFPSERLGWHALGKADALLEATLALLDRNREQVRAFISGREELDWVPPETGSVGFVRLESGDSDKLAGLAERRYETLIAPGRFFGKPDHFRIGWGMPTGDLEEGLARLGRALDA